MPFGSPTAVRGADRVEYAHPDVPQPWDSKPKIDPDEVRQLHGKEGLSPTAIARRLGIARSSVYRFLPATDQAGSQQSTKA